MAIKIFFKGVVVIGKYVVEYVVCGEDVYCVGLGVREMSMRRAVLFLGSLFG